MPDCEDIAVSTRIVVAVAAAKGVDPLALSPPLADELDVDALERLSEAETDLQVSFEAWGYRIVVDDGRVSVTEERSPTTVAVG